MWSSSKNKREQQYFKSLSLCCSRLMIKYYGLGATIGEIYKGQKLPNSIQNIINYRYIIGALFAVAAYSAVYYLFADDIETEGGILAFYFLVPTILNYIFIITTYLTPLLILGLLVRINFLYKNKKKLCRAYLFCLIFNCVSLIIMYINALEAFRYA